MTQKSAKLKKASRMIGCLAVLLLGLAANALAEKSVTEEAGAASLSESVSPQTPAQISSDEMDLIRERMMILTASLGQIPQPPKMNKKIKIPAVQLDAKPHHT